MNTLYRRVFPSAGTAPRYTKDVLHPRSCHLRRGRVPGIGRVAPRSRSSRLSKHINARWPGENGR